MKLCKIFICCFNLIFICVFAADAQLYKIDLDRKINKASLIVEGKVVDKHSFWNPEHTLIYTSNTIHIYKLFKGQVASGEVEVITQGGSVGNKCLKVSDVLQLQKNQHGMFFLYDNALKIKSPVTKKVLSDVYSSSQGFLQYDKAGKIAFAPFARYENIQQTLYHLIRQHTGIQEKIIDNNDFILNSGVVSNGTGDAAITSFSPASLNAGTLNDPSNNILTINGMGFGSNPARSAAVNFKDANDNNNEPDFAVEYNSPYIISWTDTKIVLNVPDRAATGKFSVILNNGTSVLSATELQIFYAVLNAEFDSGNGSSVIVREPRLMNANNSGGYTIQYSTSTTARGKNFDASPAKATFERALATWKEIAGANLSVGTPTSLQKVDDDRVNLVVYDNDSIGVPHMAEGVLESTYSWFSACVRNKEILTAQKTGFDIVLRNEPVSSGTDVLFEDGPCFPELGSYDLEMIILHELGHVLNLGHINDDFEDGGNQYTTVNPSKLMHYSILDYVDRRSPDASAYQGVLYTITPQHNDYGSCGLFPGEMSPLPNFAISNDECPSTFPATELQNNTTITFDLPHATSNKFKDPSFKQVNCKNTGTFVTNNAYYAFLTGAKADIILNIKDYTTTPLELTSCNGQSVRMALYDVQSCPEGQSYPQPVACSTFGGDGTISLTGLQSSHKYLLYFDGIRNTKASFNIVFKTDSSNVGPSTTFDVFPNPVSTGDLQIRITNPVGTFYEYALFDAVGKLLLTGKASVDAFPQVFALSIKNVAAGIYFLRLKDDSGKTVMKKKILKENK